MSTPQSGCDAAAVQKPGEQQELCSSCLCSFQHVRSQTHPSFQNMSAGVKVRASQHCLGCFPLPGKLLTGRNVASRNIPRLNVFFLIFFLMTFNVFMSRICAMVLCLCVKPHEPVFHQVQALCRLQLVMTAKFQTKRFAPVSCQIKTCFLDQVFTRIVSIFNLTTSSGSFSVRRLGQTRTKTFSCYMRVPLWEIILITCRKHVNNICSKRMVVSCHKGAETWMHQSGLIESSQPCSQFSSPQWPLMVLQSQLPLQMKKTISPTL